MCSICCASCLHLVLSDFPFLTLATIIAMQLYLIIVLICTPNEIIREGNCNSTQWFWLENPKDRVESGGLESIMQNQTQWATNIHTQQKVRFGIFCVWFVDQVRCLGEVSAYIFCLFLKLGFIFSYFLTWNSYIFSIQVHCSICDLWISSSRSVSGLQSLKSVPCRDKFLIWCSSIYLCGRVIILYPI